MRTGSSWNSGVKFDQRVNLMTGGDGGGGQFLVQRQYALLAAPLHVAHVPTQRFKEGGNELGARVGFFPIQELPLPTHEQNGLAFP